MEHLVGPSKRLHCTGDGPNAEAPPAPSGVEGNKPLQLDVQLWGSLLNWNVKTICIKLQLLNWMACLNCFELFSHFWTVVFWWGALTPEKLSRSSARAEPEQREPLERLNAIMRDVDNMNRAYEQLNNGGCAVASVLFLVYRDHEHWATIYNHKIYFQRIWSATWV